MHGSNRFLKVFFFSGVLAKNVMVEANANDVAKSELALFLPLVDLNVLRGESCNLLN